MNRPAPLLARRHLEHRRAGYTHDEPVAIPPSSSVSSHALAALLGLDTTNGTVYVSEGTVTGLPAVQAGIDMIAHAVAAMLTDAKVFAGDDEIAPPPIIEQPTGLIGTYEFWVQFVDGLMKRGNQIDILADFDADGFAQQVVPAHPDAVSLDDSTGFPWYTIGAATFRWDELIHTRHGAPVGAFWGAGIVERYRVAVGEQLHQAEYARNSFQTGGIPSAIVQLDTPKVSDEDAAQVQNNWLERHGNGQRKPAVIGKAMTVTPLSWSPHDAEFAESRRISVAMAALMCGLDPADLGASIGGAGLTYANLTDRQLSRILQSFTPWMRLAEEAFSAFLPDGQYMRGNVEALLRSSTRERFETYAIGKGLGIYTTPELRELEHRPTITTTEEDDPE